MPTPKVVAGSKCTNAWEAFSAVRGTQNVLRRRWVLQLCLWRSSALCSSSFSSEQAIWARNIPDQNMEQPYGHAHWMSLDPLICYCDKAPPIDPPASNP